MSNKCSCVGIIALKLGKGLVSQKNKKNKNKNKKKLG